MNVRNIVLIAIMAGLLVAAGCGNKTAGYVAYSGQYGGQQAGAYPQQQYPAAGGCGIAAPAVTNEPVGIKPVADL